MALPKLTGMPLMGAIHSLGARREAGVFAIWGVISLTPIRKLRRRPARRSGTIANPEAIALLESGETSIVEAVRTEWGLAVLRGVSALRQQGRTNRRCGCVVCYAKRPFLPMCDRPRLALPC